MELEGLQAVFAHVVKVWPNVGPGFETFEQYLGALHGGAPPTGWREHAPDLYLCCACLEGDSRGQRIFEKQVLPAAVKAVARIKADDEFIQEALQLLRTKLLVGPAPGLREYSGRGPLLAWLRVTATRLAIDLTRARSVQSKRLVSNPPAQGLEHLAAVEIDPAFGELKRRYADAFQAALERAVNELPRRERNILRLRLVAGCSIDQLGRMYEKDRATTARWLRSARERVLNTVRRTLQAQHGLTRKEFDSIARLVLSQLELRASAFGTNGGETLGVEPSAPCSSSADTADRA